MLCNHGKCDQACRKRNTSSPGLDSLERNDWDRHTCSKKLCDSIRRSRRGIHRQKLLGGADPRHGRLALTQVLDSFVPGVQSGHKSSNDHRPGRRHSGGVLGSQLAHARNPGNGNTAWYRWSWAAGSCCSHGQAVYSCSTIAQSWSKPRRSGRRCHTCSRHGA